MVPCGDSDDGAIFARAVPAPVSELIVKGLGSWRTCVLKLRARSAQVGLPFFGDWNISNGSHDDDIAVDWLIPCFVTGHCGDIESVVGRGESMMFSNGRT